ncbi:lactate/malate dehydrogenase, NAD binding domain [Popillia japonica]|uniref:Lactate/malate dehydrogenase, NAD binding domain n=1 Tax=Popillia japonica TaxID=7064 RepID=A0AAW1MNZ1_POPJA
MLYLDYASSADSKICIVTAGATVAGDNKELTAKQNTEIFKEIIPELVKYSPNCILIICSQPVDIMTYVAWKLSSFQPYRVIGSGTILESARLRFLIAQRLEVEASSCQAFVIGEHGRKSVPVWSAVSVSGVRLREVNPNLGTDNDPEDWQELHKQVVESAEEVNRLKQCGSWGMALSISRLVRAIIEDSRECYPISTHIKVCFARGVGIDIEDIDEIFIEPPDTAVLTDEDSGDKDIGGLVDNLSGAQLRVPVEIKLNNSERIGGCSLIMINQVFFPQHHLSN